MLMFEITFRVVGRSLATSDRLPNSAAHLLCLLEQERKGRRKGNFIRDLRGLKQVVYAIVRVVRMVRATPSQNTQLNTVNTLLLGKLNRISFNNLQMPAAMLLIV
jgi:hypothetical protein